LPTPEEPRTGRHTAASPEIIKYKGFNTLLAELEASAAAVSGERAYPIAPEDILHGVAVFEAIVRSAERHQPVTVART
jgi:predicted dehydrogenase